MGTLLETWVLREGTHEDYVKMQQIRKGENLESLLTDVASVAKEMLNKQILQSLCK